MAYENITYHVSGGIGRITFNRPQVMNALTPAMLKELKTAVLEAGKTKDVKVIVLILRRQGFLRRGRPQGHGRSEAGKRQGRRLSGRARP